MAKKSDKPKERYLKIPYHILNIGDLGLREKVLLAYIYSFGDKGCWQSNETIAKVFFTHPSSIKRWLRKINKYLYIKAPKGYYRTMWARSHPDVRNGVKRWVEEQKERQANRAKKTDSSGSKVNHNLLESEQVTGSKMSPRLAQKRATIKNHTIREITKDTTATPTPLPVEGQVSALLKDRQDQTISEVEKTIKDFGYGPLKPSMNEAEFAQLRQAQQ